MVNTTFLLVLVEGGHHTLKKGRVFGVGGSPRGKAGAFWGPLSTIWKKPGWTAGSIGESEME